MKELTLPNNIGRAAKEKPLYFVFIAIIIIIAVYFVLDALEIAPEFENAERREGRALEKGDNLLWLGMEITPISRNIRKEFDIPRRVKGVLVVNDGRGAAREHGIKTGDVICSINRKRVFGRRSFINVVNGVKYYDGILIDIYRDGKRRYISVPFLYEYGPLFGPNKGHWQLGAPLWEKAMPYGPVFKRR
jgi:hypothetical protein